MSDEKWLYTLLKEHVDSKGLFDDIVSITEIVGKGFINRTFLISTIDSKYIFRISDEISGNEYVKEKWCMEQAKKIQIPTSQVLFFGKYESFHYMAETYIPGINGLDSSFSDEIWFQIGRLAKKFHSIPVSGFGLELSDEHRGIFRNPFQATLEEQVCYNSSCLRKDDILISLGAYEENNIHIIRSIFDYIIQSNYHIGLNHGDLSRKNTIIDNDMRISLIDYGCAIAHIVPFYDFAYILGETVKGREPDISMLKHFANGYGISLNIIDDMKKDIFAVMLLTIFDKVRWCFAHNDKDAGYYAQFANKVLKETTKYFG